MHGDDPEGLGPWPSPTTPSGLALPRLPMGGKLAELLEQDRAPEDLHRAVHLVAELVEAGQLPADKWRATYVFSGWHEELVVKALELRAKQAWVEQRRRETRASEPTNESTTALEISRAAMLRTMGESITLRAVADVLQEPPPEHRSPRQATTPDDYLERLDVRSHVQAMAEQLGREPGDVLRALGRGSMRELEVSDRQRLAQVFAELSSGP